jgi:hypothetical protein
VSTRDRRAARYVLQYGQPILKAMRYVAVARIAKEVLGSGF